jgi:cbb3-type cytochrome c oxidase subunit III
LQDFAAVERGRYLAIAADCGSCHTVPGSDQPFSGGRAIETPFGVLAAPNITSDRETGIGAWTDDQFDAAVRNGISRNGARLYPAMPFPYYSRMSREDTKDIRAYLNTIAPVSNAVRVNRLPFPLNLRTSMLVWDQLYFMPGEFRPDASKSQQWNRGAYLVQGPEHCGACHTPKTFLGGDKSSEALQGSTLQGWTAPDITSGQGPLGDWTPDDIATYLKTGHNRHAAAAGLMGEVVDLSTSKLTESDVHAIAEYLKDVSGPAQENAGSADKDVLTAGGAIYQDLCSACHAQDGKGVPNLFPNLAEAATVKAKDPTTVLRVILQGAQTVSTDREPTGPAMPAFGWQLDDAKIAAVATYVRNHFGKAPAVNESDVRKTRTAETARTN